MGAANADIIVFLGGDKRQAYAAEELQQSFEIYAEGLVGNYPSPTALGDSEKACAIVLPIPALHSGAINAPYSEREILPHRAVEFASLGAAVFGGVIPPQLKTLYEERGLRVFDMMQDEDFALKNAWLTAENAAALLIQATDGSVYGAKALVTGYGRCGAYMARLLKALGARVTVCARNPKQRAMAALDGHFTASFAGIKAAAGCADYIVNTVPAMIFDESVFAAAKKGALFMELASLPPKPTEDFAQSAGVGYIHAGGLPGKYSPKTAGKLIAKFISDKLSPQIYDAAPPLAGKDIP